MKRAAGLSPYRQGFCASQRGPSASECPYATGSSQWRAWWEGWREACGIPDDENDTAASEQANEA
jgi:ribosome modulation factor